MEHLLKSRQHPHFGAALVLVAAVCYGLNPMFAQVLYNDGFSATTLALYRFLLPALLFAPFLTIPRGALNEVFTLILFGVCNGLALSWYFSALNHINPATAILLYFTYPVFCIALGWVVYRRQPGRNAWLAGGLILLACSLGVTPEQLRSGQLWELLSCLATPILYAAFLQYMAQPQRKLNAYQCGAWSTLGHLLVLVPMVAFAAIEQDIKLLPDSWLSFTNLLGIALLASALPQLCMLVGIRRTSADQAAIFGSLEFVVAMLCGTLLLGQALDQLQITAMLLILIALLIKKHPPAAPVVKRNLVNE